MPVQVPISWAERCVFLIDRLLVVAHLEPFRFGAPLFENFVGYDDLVRFGDGPKTAVKHPVSVSR